MLLRKAYSYLNKTLSPSTSTKTNKKPDDTFVPMYPSVEERLISMQQRRIDACKHLPADHPLQPPVIEPIQFIPTAAEGESDHVGTDLADTIVSSTPNSPTTQTIEISEPLIILNLESHYSSELPEYMSTSKIASDIAFDEVMTECPPQHTPNSEMATTTNIDFVPMHEILVPELTVPEQNVSEQSATELTTNSQSTTSNIHELETFINDQPSSSNLAIKPVASAKTNVPSSPTLFLNSTILANVCDSIFEELNSLVQARNNLIHEDNYEKLWTRLKDRVEFVLPELQRSCFDAQELAQAKLQEWLKVVVSNLDEVKILRTWVKIPLCLEASSVISSSIHPRELNLD